MTATPSSRYIPAAGGHLQLDQDHRGGHAAGFRVHYDFTGRRGRTLGGVLPIVAASNEITPSSHWIEDPFDTADIESWRELRRRTQLTVVHGGSWKLGGGHEAQLGMADAYMIYPPIGDLIATATTMASSTSRPSSRWCGGTLAKSMAMHVACTMPTATGHSIHLDDQLDAEDDITRKRFPVTEGFSRVSEEPGLGFDVDEDLLYKYRDNCNEIAPYVGVVRLSGGRTIYPSASRTYPRSWARRRAPSANYPYDRWFDDGSEEWARTYERVGNEEWYVE